MYVSVQNLNINMNMYKREKFDLCLGHTYIIEARQIFWYKPIILSIFHSLQKHAWVKKCTFSPAFQVKSCVSARFVHQKLGRARTNSFWSAAHTAGKRTHGTFDVVKELPANRLVAAGHGNMSLMKMHFFFTIHWLSLSAYLYFFTYLFATPFL